MNHFGRLLRQKRRAAGFSQRRLAVRAGVDFSYISKLENGRLPPAAATTIVKLARSLGCPAAPFLAAARKLPEGLSNRLAATPTALRFLLEAQRLKPSTADWARLTMALRRLCLAARSRSRRR